MQKRNNALSFIESLLHPLWHYLFILIPMFFLSYAFVQTYYYNVIFRDPITININNLDYIHQIFFNKNVIIYSFVFLPILYSPFIVSLLSIKILGKLDLSIKWKNLVVFLFSTVGMNLLLLIYLQLVLGVGDNLFKITLGSIGFVLLIIAIVLLLNKYWKSGEAEAIKQTVVIFIASTIIAITFLLIINNSIANHIHYLIYAGLIKDLIFLSIIYILLNSFSVWNLIRLSTDSLFGKLGRKRKSNLLLSEIKYTFPIIICIVILVLALLGINQELAWYGVSFKQISRIIYGPLNQLQIDLLWSFHNDHIIYRTAICLIGGVIFPTIVLIFIKIGAHTIYSKRLTRSSSRPL
jgi:hypothetical protein